MADIAVEKKKIVLSGIQPSGNQFTLGNYIARSATGQICRTNLTVST